MKDIHAKSEAKLEAWLERQMEARWEAETDKMKEAKFLREQNEQESDDECSN